LLPSAHGYEVPLFLLSISRRSSPCYGHTLLLDMKGGGCEYHSTKFISLPSQECWSAGHGMAVSDLQAARKRYAIQLCGAYHAAISFSLSFVLSRFYFTLFPDLLCAPAFLWPCPCRCHWSKYKEKLSDLSRTILTKIGFLPLITIFFGLSTPTSRQIFPSPFPQSAYPYFHQFLDFPLLYRLYPFSMLLDR
jgi:hypothetical protein